MHYDDQPILEFGLIFIKILVLVDLRHSIGYWLSESLRIKANFYEMHLIIFEKHSVGIGSKEGNTIPALLEQTNRLKEIFSYLELY